MTDADALTVGWRFFEESRDGRKAEAVSLDDWEDTVPAGISQMERGAGESWLGEGSPGDKKGMPALRPAYVAGYPAVRAKHCSYRRRPNIYIAERLRLIQELLERLVEIGKLPATGGDPLVSRGLAELHLVGTSVR